VDVRGTGNFGGGSANLSFSTGFRKNDEIGGKEKFPVWRGPVRKQDSAVDFSQFQMMGCNGDSWGRYQRWSRMASCFIATSILTKPEPTWWGETGVLPGLGMPKRKKGAGYLFT